MKLIPPVKYSLLFTTMLFLVLFYSCNKNKTAAHLSGLEFIHCTINGTPYNFDMPADSVFTDSLTESLSFTTGGHIIGNRVPANSIDLTRIIYNKGMLLGGNNFPVLVSFYTPQTGLYPQFTTSASPIIISITEFGTVNQYVAGNFSAVMTGPAPAYLTFNVACGFRVRRRL